ncbi:MAG: glycogen debranching enzyme GlgX, partial [Candidatus Eremiobacteraeota bacterium]|nr:glycogen debranching enzyme GlgX [Candidatus Eremiobacteraeota bacterium]
NRDGSDDNNSWNCGVEGPTDDPKVLELREKQKRNFFATLLLSQGLPMLLAGDELGHTQLGNNNAYCQDNEMSWIDWSGVHHRNGGRNALLEFVRELVALRRAHPVFRRPRFFRGVTMDDSPLKDITWFSPKGTEMSYEDWTDGSKRCFGALLGGDTGDRFISLQGYPEIDETFFLLFNGHEDGVEFMLPQALKVTRWVRIVDTAAGAQALERVSVAPGSPFSAAGRSFTLFQGDESW